MRVLIIDDSRSSLALLASIVADIGIVEIATCISPVDALALSEREARSVRGRDIGMIFQEPMTSLNPVLTVGAQIREVLRRHERLSAREAQARFENAKRYDDDRKRYDERYDQHGRSRKKGGFDLFDIFD